MFLPNFEPRCRFSIGSVSAVFSKSAACLEMIKHRFTSLLKTYQVRDERVLARLLNNSELVRKTPEQLAQITYLPSVSNFSSLQPHPSVLSSSPPSLCLLNSSALQSLENSGIAQQSSPTGWTVKARYTLVWSWEFSLEFLNCIPPHAHCDQPNFETQITSTTWSLGQLSNVNFVWFLCACKYNASGDSESDCN